VQVGNFDTYPSGQGGGSSGCWGVYHNFPSGNIIASNINVGGAGGELWILTPNFVRACYLEGKITNAITGAVLQNAQIEVVGSNPILQELSGTNGLYKTGQEEEGYYKVRVTKSGYRAFETLVHLQHGELITLNVPLYPNGLANLSGTVIRHEDGQPVENATVWLYGNQNTVSTNTDATGSFLFNNIPLGNYDIAASAPGLGMGILSGKVVTNDTNVELELFTSHRREALQAGKGAANENDYLKLRQNPFATETVLEYSLPVEGATLSLFNSLNQKIDTQILTGISGQCSVGAGLPEGLYLAVLAQGNQILEIKKLIKIQD
jgi:hypothetical protein